MNSTKTIREEKWVLAPLGKRSLAFLIDFALFLGLILLLGLIAKPIGNALWNMDGLLEQITQWQKDYGLLIFQEGSWIMASSVESSMHQAYTEVATAAVTAYYGYQNYLEMIKGLVAISLVFLVPPLIFKDGKTIGKRVTKIRVITVKGEPVRPVIMMFRVLIGMWAVEYVISVLYSYIGVLVSMVFVFLTKRQTAIHDIIGRTMVVLDEKKIIEVEVPDEPIEAETTEVETTSEPE